jgi:hypothetical protein
VFTRHVVARRAVMLACLALVISVVAAGSALAAGSPTIGTPSLVTPFADNVGPQYGNTATDQMGTIRGVCGGTSEEYWLFYAFQDAKVVLQGAEMPPASGICVDIFPPGTKQWNVAQAAPVVEVPISQGATFTASKSGRYVLAVGRGASGSDGPFTFTVNTYIKVLVSFVGLKSKIPASGKIAARVYYPDGSSVKGGIRLKLYGIWKDSQSKPATTHLLATREPNRQGLLSFAYRLPKKLQGEHIRLQITGQLKYFQPIASAIRRVQVKKAG